MEIKDIYAYNSVDVAMYIVAYANERKYGMNMTKLQKLLYIAYGTFLAVKRYRLTDEHPQAWPYGPVFPATRSNLLKRNFLDIVYPSSLTQDDVLKSLVHLVFDTFGDRTAGTLSEWSHRLGSPWDRTVSMPSFYWGAEIPNTYICEYFAQIIVRNESTR